MIQTAQEGGDGTDRKREIQTGRGDDTDSTEGMIQTERDTDITEGMIQTAQRGWYRQEEGDTDRKRG